MSSVHITELEIGLIGHENEPMPLTNKSIAKRLEMTRDALGKSAAEICREIRCKPNRWSQYEGGDRRITLEIADRLCEKYGITLDWIYRNNPSGLPKEILEKVASRSAA